MEEVERCWAPDCTHSADKHPCEFFPFPGPVGLRSKWISLTRRQGDKPGPGDKLCSCHFKDGKKKLGPILLRRPGREQVEKVSVGVQVGPEKKVFTGTALLEAENYFLTEEVKKLKAALEAKPSFSLDLIKDSESKMMLYTGLANQAVFSALFNSCCRRPLKYALNWKVERIPKADQLLMCLMKLRQNFPHEDLGVRFQVAQGTVTNIVMTWVAAIHRTLFADPDGHISFRRKSNANLPTVYATLTNCPEAGREVEKPSRGAWKVVLGVASDGVITFVSPVSSGQTSDDELVQSTGVLHGLQPGDLVLTEAGGLFRSDPGDEDSEPTLATGEAGAVARGRSLVDRAVAKMQAFKVLANVPSSLGSYLGQVVQVVGALANLQHPLMHIPNKPPNPPPTTKTPSTNPASL